FKKLSDQHARAEHLLSAEQKRLVCDHELYAIWDSVSRWLKLQAGRKAKEVEDYKQLLGSVRTRTNNENLSRAGIPKKFHIINSGEYGEARYGIAISPEKIFILSD